MRDEYDFSNARLASDVPALAHLQKENEGKERITIRLDADILTLTLVKNVCFADCLVCGILRLRILQEALW